MKKWEYKYIVIESIHIGKKIDKWGLGREYGQVDWEQVEELGKEGWELVSSCPLICEGGMGSNTLAVYLFFKRELK